LATGGPLLLGGISIPHGKHAVGHSDADALLHAVTDALLGAAALGDIGELYPDTKSENRDRDSADMLSAVYRQVRELGYRLINVDAVVHAERPKLGPYKLEIRRRVAGVLGLPEGCVSIKAKTAEGAGPIGREEVIDVRCVVLIERGEPAGGL